METIVMLPPTNPSWYLLLWVILVADMVVHPQLMSDTVVFPHLIANVVISLHLVADMVVFPNLVTDTVISPPPNCRHCRFFPT